MKIYRGADKSLARPSAKIRWKSSHLDFLGSRRHPPHGLSSKGPNYQRAVLLISAGLVAVAFFLPGRTKDLSASLYITPTASYKRVGKNSYDANVVTLFITCSQCILYLVCKLEFILALVRDPLKRIQRSSR